MSENGSNRTWDHEDCPHDWCGGELQQQDRFNVTCLECETAWSHIRLPATYNEPEKHCLQDAGGEVWAEKPAVATDGGADYGSGIPECDRCEGGGDVFEEPEAGYWTCRDCGARGAGREPPVWWHNDPDSMWYEGEKA